MVTPPAKDGGLNPDILAAAAGPAWTAFFLYRRARRRWRRLLMGRRLYRRLIRLSAQGNILWLRRKKQLYGVVDIDMVAGPSGILILADKTANPRYLAADLMSQAEHDVLASAVLLTTSKRWRRQPARNWSGRQKGFPAVRSSGVPLRIMARRLCVILWATQSIFCERARAGACRDLYRNPMDFTRAAR